MAVLLEVVEVRAADVVLPEVSLFFFFSQTPENIIVGKKEETTSVNCVGSFFN